MRFTLIASRNDATGRFDSGEACLDAAEKLGLEVYTKPWRDPWTDAYGRYYGIRKRHLKRFPRAVRRALVNS